MVDGQCLPFDEVEMRANLLERFVLIAEVALLELFAEMVHLELPELFAHSAVFFQAETSSDEGLDEGVLSPFDELEFSATLL